VTYGGALPRAGLRRAVVSSSTNCADVLAAAGIAELFETRIDGVTVEAQHLARPTPTSPPPVPWV
jgi:beta-phosphoglucomutase-like phosphatase (HAD superfamily)